MDNAQKAIMIGVGVFITILIIAAVMVLVNLGIDLLNRGTQSAQGLSEVLTRKLTSDYDNTTVSGAKLLSAVEQFSVEDNMVIEVKATTSASYLELGTVRGNGDITLDKGLPYDSSNVKSSISALKNSADSENYVSSTARYKAELIRSSSGDVVMGIRFTRVN